MAEDEKFTYDPKKDYVVVDAYVTLKTQTPQGPRLVGFYKGAPVPKDVPKEQIEHHLRGRQIEAVDKPEDVPAPVAGPSGGPPPDMPGDQAPSNQGLSPEQAELATQQADSLAQADKARSGLATKRENQAARSAQAKGAGAPPPPKTG